MAFRADIVKMIEDMVTKIEEHHFKINSNMKSDFVMFVNSFFKRHMDQPDINFTLNVNVLYADTAGVKIIIATDSTMAFSIPGCTIPMRDQIEAFIVVDEIVAYDSYKMRCFRKATPEYIIQALLQPPSPALSPVASLPATSFNFSTHNTPLSATTPPAPPSVTPPAQPSTTPPSTTSFNFSTHNTPSSMATPSLTTSPSMSAPSTTSFNFTPSKPPETPPSTFNFPSTSPPSTFNVQPTTTSAFHLATIPAKPFASPTNLFAAR